MAHRVSGTARKSGTGRTSRLDYGSRVSEEQTGRAIPLNLGPMLAVYKGRRRLSLRIERMPPLARLSVGRNNGDNSWSLAFSEIDTVAYLPPEGSANEPLTLSVRIIDLGEGGSTVAVLDLSVTPTVANEINHTNAAGEDDLRSLREELDKAKAALQARETDLTEMRQKAQQAESELSRRRIEAELGGGRGSRKNEADESKFASLDANLLLRKDNQPSDSEAAASEQDSDAFLVRKGRAQPSTVAPDGAGGLTEEHVTTRIAEARRVWAREAEAALSRAEAAWKAEEAKRVAAVEAQWRARSESGLAQLAERCARAEAALAEASSRATGMESKAEATWRAEEAKRLAAAEAQWRSQSASALTALTARCERAEKALSEANAHAEFATQRDSDSATEIRRLREECTKLRSTVSERDTELTRALQGHEQARQTFEREAKEAISKAEAAWQQKSATAAADANARSRQEADAALAKAQITWKAEEATRLASAQASWKELSAKALVTANARCEAAENALAEARSHSKSKAAQDESTATELRRLSEQAASLQRTLAERETALRDARTAFDRDLAQMQQQNKQALEKAEAVWKTGENARVTAANVQWQEKLSKAVDESRAEVQALRERAAQSDRLRQELAEAQALLAVHDKELAEARLPLASAREAWQRDAQQSLAAAQAAWKAEEAARLAAAEAQWRRQAEKARAELALRCENAEKSAAEAQTQIEALSARDQNSRFELRRLREELAVAQANLSSSEAELEVLRAQNEPLPGSEIILKPDRISDQRPVQRERPKSRLLRDMAVVAFLGVTAVLLYPRIQAYVPQLPALTETGAVTSSETAVPEPKPVRPVSVVIHAGNLRAGPAANTPTSGTLQVGAKVEPVEKKGSWTLVRIEGPNGQTKEGWIFSDFLQDETPAASDAPAAKAPAAKPK